MIQPTNEQGVIVVFCSLSHVSGWQVDSIGAPFPDAMLSKDGEQWRTEFEFKARNFIGHGHDFRDCDLIVCWINDFPECPIPVLELSDPNWINATMKKGNPLLATVEYWRNRALKAEAALNTLVEQRESSLSSAFIGKQIVRYLIDHPGALQDEIAGALDVSVSTISREMKALTTDGVLHTEKIGRRLAASVNGGHQAYLES